MTDLYRIVLTGGPCAGKTDVLNCINTRYRDLVEVVPETATIILYEENITPEPDNYAWRLSFQRKVFERQCSDEDAAQKRAESRGIGLMVCDRGIVDIAAYLRRGFAEFEELFHVHKQVALNRYDLVIHIASLASYAPAKYEEIARTSSNHFESLKDAQEIDCRLREVWAGHENRLIINNYLENKETVLSLIGAHVPML